jgi:hypothetical protein
MARPRNIIPRIVGIDMVELASKILNMSDAEKAAWLTKAVSDCIEGCTDPSCDPFIRVQFERSLAQMRSKQEIDAQTYKNRLARQGKNVAESAICTTSEADKALADASTREGEDERTHRGNTGTLESGTSANHYGVAPHREAVDVSATDSNNSEAREAQAMESQTRTEGGSLRGGDDSRPASHSGMPSVRNGSIIKLPTEQKKPYGSCGNVMLTDAEGHHLREVYGEDLKIAIDILDAYIENNGKAAKRYKNHAAVLRKGNWVYNKLLEMKNNEQRLNNSKHQGDRRSFAQKDRDDRSNWLSTSMFEIPEAANA